MAPHNNHAYDGRTQCDAREAGLARGFEMDDRWFRLGDRCRSATDRLSNFQDTDASSWPSYLLAEGQPNFFYLCRLAEVGSTEAR